MAADESQPAENWRVAELAGRVDEADRLFGAVAAGLTVTRAPSGLANRVAQSVGGADTADTSDAPRSAARWRGVALVAILLLGSAAAVGALLALTPVLASWARELLNFSAEGFVWVVGAVDGGLGGWAILRRVGRGIGEAISTPGVTGGLIGIELVGVAALYALHRLLRVDREPTSKEDKPW